MALTLDVALPSDTNLFPSFGMELELRFPDSGVESSYGGEPSYGGEGYSSTRYSGGDRTMAAMVTAKVVNRAMLAATVAATAMWTMAVATTAAIGAMLAATRDGCYQKSGHIYRHKQEPRKMKGLLKMKSLL